MTWIEWSRIAFAVGTLGAMFALNVAADILWFERDGAPGTISHAFAVWGRESQLVAPLFAFLAGGAALAFTVHFFVGRVTGR